MVQSTPNDETTELANHILRDHNALSLSYICEGQPEVCAVWYANEETRALYFLSSLSSKHGMTFRTTRDVAFAIHLDKQDWFKIRGIQGKGIVSHLGSLEGPEWEIYQEKFPFLREKNPGLENALESAQLWKITPSWIRIIDNTRHFGFKAEFDLQH